MAFVSQTKTFSASSTSCSLTAIQATGKKVFSIKKTSAKPTYHLLRIEQLARMLSEIRDGVLFQDVNELTFHQKDAFGRKISGMYDTNHCHTIRNVPGELFNARVYDPKLMLRSMAPSWGMDSTNMVMVRGYHLLYACSSIMKNFKYTEVIQYIFPMKVIELFDKYLLDKLKSRGDFEAYTDCLIPGRSVKSNLYSIADLEDLMKWTMEWLEDSVYITLFPM